jgi:hypothetical protein
MGSRFQLFDGPFATVTFCFYCLGFIQRVRARIEHGVGDEIASLVLKTPVMETLASCEGFGRVVCEGFLISRTIHRSHGHVVPVISWFNCGGSRRLDLESFPTAN